MLEAGIEPDAATFQRNTLNHYYFSPAIFVNNGGHILTLQKVLGHSDLKLTMRYAHLAPDYLDEVKDKGPLIGRWLLASFSESEHLISADRKNPPPV